MTIGMQRVKAASGSLMRQSGIVYAFIYQLLLVPSEAPLSASGAEKAALALVGWAEQNF